jgi:hypothetical protein
MFATRAALGPATVEPRAISIKPERRRIASAIAASVGKFFDRLVAGSTQNLGGPNRTLSPEYFRFPPL